MVDRDRLLSPAEWLVERWARRERWFELSNARKPNPLTPPPGPAAAAEVAFAPLRTGQRVPLLGEDVPWEVDPCDDDELRYGR